MNSQFPDKANPLPDLKVGAPACRQAGLGGFDPRSVGFRAPPLKLWRHAADSILNVPRPSAAASRLRLSGSNPIKVGAERSRKGRIKTIDIFYRQDNHKAVLWDKKIRRWLWKNHPAVKIVTNRPQALLVLGGDGTILEAVRKYHKSNPIIFGLNLGHVGFAASVRKPKKFLPSLNKFLKGRYNLVKQMMLTAIVMRKNKPIFTTDALNEICIQNPLSIVEIEVAIEGHSFQYIRGTGALVSTAAGSTAYNLSAHGPIVMPNIKCFILTEILDHNIPTPSAVIKYDKTVYLKILDYRQRGLLSITETNKRIDVLLVADGETIFPLEKNDTIVVRRSPRLAKFAEIEKNYFFKSLQEKFAFK